LSIVNYCYRFMHVNVQFKVINGDDGNVYSWNRNN